MPKIHGEIGYFQLSEWWLSSFTAAERAHIELVYQPFSIGTVQAKPLTQGTISSTSYNALQFLYGLAGWFKKTPTDRAIAQCILARAEQEVQPNSDIEHVHFLYSTMVEVYYKDRSEGGFLNRTIEACEAQIAIAPQVVELMRRKYPGAALPSHTGFKRLAIIREKQKDYAAVIQLCQLAQVQGWAGDWQRRIERSEKSVSKLAKK